MSLYHSFRKTGRKKEISNRPRSCPLGSDSRILYAHIKTGMQKKHPCFAGAPGGNRPPDCALLAGCLLASHSSASDHSLPEAPQELLATLVPSRVRFPHIICPHQNRDAKKHPCFAGAPGGNRTRGLHIRSVLLYPLSYWRR